MTSPHDKKLAVLIDADNIPHHHVKDMLEEVAKYGLPTIKRIYGDWTKPNLNAWKGVLLETAIAPIQQYGYTTGKNATDSAMIIDAMDILHARQVDGFCIVSSDSDFTRLATRLRESGMLVLGLGEKKTPRPFIVACDKFIYLENLTKAQPAEEGKAPAPKPQPLRIDRRSLELLRFAVRDKADEDGWARLSDVGDLLNKWEPDFDSRTYGFDKLSKLFKAMEKYFEVDARKSSSSSSSQVRHLFVRVRE